jgi:uncharacterized protein with HEPN domain
VTARDVRIFIDDMVAAADGILSMTSGLDLAHFMASPVLQKAIIHDLMVLGEAAARVPDDVRRPVQTSHGVVLSACATSSSIPISASI